MSDDAAPPFARSMEDAGIVEGFVPTFVAPVRAFVRRAASTPALPLLLVSLVLCALFFAATSFMRLESEVAASQSGETERAPYEAPRLKEHGSLPDLTQKIGKNAKKDGGSWPKNRSAP